MIILYDINKKEIIAEVNSGEGFAIPQNISYFEGTLQEFQKEFPDYKIKNDEEITTDTDINTVN